MSEATKKEVYSWVKSIVFALIVAIICRNFLFSPAIVYGESMLPTFQEHDRLLLSKVSEIQRFDLVVFNAPDSDERYIKRVIGLPGDIVEVKDDTLYINGKQIEEPYLEDIKKDLLFDKLTGDFTLEELTGEAVVPEGTLFVMGDNRLHSKDSRFFGPIPISSLIGEVKLQIYPKIGMPE
ncbi:signal peptidase I [Robertmurraya korlensis]|uniref:signal peptidase I n=1 Tax=Robertmurraya korlensis TaxID=519977 RepID=UPI000826B3C6|nr:signal peptidase I [Robertmurraya korlensis]